MNINRVYKNQKTFINVILVLVLIIISGTSAYIFYKDGNELKRFSQIKRMHFKVVERVSRQLMVNCESLNQRNLEKSINTKLLTFNMIAKVQIKQASQFRDLVFSKLLITVMDRNKVSLAYSGEGHGRIVRNVKIDKCTGVI